MSDGAAHTRIQQATRTGSFREPTDALELPVRRPSASQQPAAATAQPEKGSLASLFRSQTEASTRPNLTVEVPSADSKLGPPVSLSKRQTRTSMTHRSLSVVGEDFHETGVPEQPPSRFLIDPDSRWRVGWDWILVLLYLYSLIWVPIQIAFDRNDVWDIPIDTLFFIDIALHFFTCYQDKRGHLVTSFKEIVINYLTGWFALDFMAAFPVYALTKTESEGVRGLRMIRLFRITRIFKLPKYQSRIDNLEFSSRISIHPAISRLVKLFVMMCVVAHFYGCMWIWIATAYPIEVELDGTVIYSWLASPNYGYLNFSQQRQYLHAIYWAVTTLVTVGYGDIVAHTSREMIMAMCVMISGATFFGALTASVASMVSTFDRRSLYMREKMQSLFLFTDSVAITPASKQLLVKYLRVKWDREFATGAAEWNELRDQIPDRLRVRLVMEMFQDLLLIPQTFLPRMYIRFPSFVVKLLSEMTSHSYSPGEVIGRHGTPCDNFIIIDSGMVEACSGEFPQLVLRRLGRGSVMGNVGLMLAPNVWEATYFVPHTSKTCQVFVVSRQIWFKLIGEVDSSLVDNDLAEDPDAYKGLIDSLGMKLPEDPQISLYFKSKSLRAHLLAKAEQYRQSLQHREAKFAQQEAIRKAKELKEQQEAEAKRLENLQRRSLFKLMRTGSNSAKTFSFFNRSHSQSSAPTLRRGNSLPVKDSVAEPDLRSSLTAAHLHAIEEKFRSPVAASPAVVEPAAAAAAASAQTSGTDGDAADDSISRLAQDIAIRRASTTSSRFAGVHPHLHEDPNISKHTNIRLQIFRELVRKKMARKRASRVGSPISSSPFSVTVTVPAPAVVDVVPAVAAPLSPIAEKSPTSAGANGPEFH